MSKRKADGITPANVKRFTSLSGTHPKTSKKFYIALSMICNEIIGEITKQSDEFKQSKITKRGDKSVKFKNIRLKPSSIGKWAALHDHQNLIRRNDHPNPWAYLVLTQSHVAIEDTLLPR